MFNSLGGGCFQNPFIPVVKIRSVKRNLKDDAEREMGLIPGESRFGMGRDAADR